MTVLVTHQYKDAIIETTYRDVLSVRGHGRSIDIIHKNGSLQSFIPNVIAPEIFILDQYMIKPKFKINDVVIATRAGFVNIFPIVKIFTSISHVNQRYTYYDPQSISYKEEELSLYVEQININGPLAQMVRAVAS